MPVIPVPGRWQVEAAESRVQGHPWLYSMSEASPSYKTPHFKKRVEEDQTESLTHARQVLNH